MPNAPTVFDVGPGLERVITAIILAAPSALAAFYAYKANQKSTKAVEDIAAVHKEVNSTASQLRDIAVEREKANVQMSERVGRAEAESKLLK